MSNDAIIITREALQRARGDVLNVGLYLKAAGIPVRGRGRPSESKAKPAISREVSTSASTKSRQAGASFVGGGASRRLAERDHVTLGDDLPRRGVGASFANDRGVRDR